MPRFDQKFVHVIVRELNKADAYLVQDFLAVERDEESVMAFPVVHLRSPITVMKGTLRFVF